MDAHSGVFRINCAYTKNVFGGVVRRHIWIFIALAFLSATTRMVAQDKPGQQNPAIPTDVLGSQLIAWSQLQTPEPVVQHRSQDDRPVRPSDQPSNPTQTFTDRANTDANQDGNRFIPSVTNGVNQFVNTL
jgi:hypothetical protein